MNHDLYRLIGKHIEDPNTFTRFLEINSTSLKACSRLINDKNIQFKIMNIIGLKIEFYVGEWVRQLDYNKLLENGEYSDFEYFDKILKRHILYGRFQGEYYKICLSQRAGECGSGYTTATWAHINIEKIDRIDGFGYIPLNPLNITYPFTTVKCICTDDKTTELVDLKTKSVIAACSKYGGCRFYPTGYYNINMALFEKTIRAKDKRPIWIFKGNSGTGKSFLSARLENMSVFETDAYRVLPAKIPLIHNIIVLGNKYKYTIENIKQCLQEPYELHEVTFI